MKCQDIVHGGGFDFVLPLVPHIEAEGFPLRESFTAEDNAVAMASRPAAMEIGGAFGQVAAWLWSFHFVAAMVSKSETMEADGAVEEIVPWRLAAR
uniref:Uncharacterized protein n=1 Tax=Fagus sylvatica TaxID=28930 RepID=A0A2N9GSS8_FAGSY